VPSFLSCMAFSTFLEAFFPYFAIRILPFFRPEYVRQTWPIKDKGRAEKPAHVSSVYGYCCEPERPPPCEPLCVPPLLPPADWPSPCLRPPPC
jgi:hypothetical protein